MPRYFPVGSFPENRYTKNPVEGNSAIMWRTVTIAAAAAAVAVMALLAVAISPWHDVANHPVRLTLQEPVDAVEICWQADACQNFVRKPDDANLWLAELPPARQYDIRLRFPNGVRAPQQARITIINTNELANTFLNQAATPLMDLPFEIPTLAPAGEVSIGPISAPSAELKNTIGLFATLLVMAIGALLLIRSLLIKIPTPARGSASIPMIMAISIAATILHVVLVHNLPVLYLQGIDSDDYLLHGTNIADHFRYGIPSRGAWGETIRTPGYAVLLAGSFWTLGRHLWSAALAQSILFMAAVASLAVSLRRWASSVTLGAMLLIAAILPPYIEMSRAILSDGPAATFALLSVAAFIEATCQQEKLRRTMMWTGALATAVAVMMRPAMAVVLVIPGLMALQTLVDEWRKTQWRSAQNAAAILWLGAAPTIVVVAGWSAYNWMHYRYFGAANNADIVRFAGRMDTGTFDVRALAYSDDSLRRAYLIGRESTGYWQYHVHISGPIDVHFVKDRTRVVKQLNAGISEVIARSDRLNPWQLAAVWRLRGIWWAAFLPSIENYNGYPINFQVLEWKVDPSEFNRVFPSLVLDNAEPGALLGYLHEAARIYNAVRPEVYALALLATLLALYLGGWPLALPMLVQTANLLAHAALGLVYARYVQGLDILLFAQIAIGLTLGWTLLAARGLRNGKPLAQT